MNHKSAHKYYIIYREYLKQSKLKVIVSVTVCCLLYSLVISYLYEI